MQSNPIQQRIELICEKWEDAKVHCDARIVRIQCHPDEVDMVDTFYTYIIATDTPVLDIAFHFDSSCFDLRSFSISLLRELEEVIYIWNNSEKDERIDNVPIRWQPDHSLKNDKNPALLFVENFNRLAEEMELGADLFAVAILKGKAAEKLLPRWLSMACEAGISPRVKFLIHDTTAKPVFHSLALERYAAVTTIPLNLDMPKAMEQVAGMGDPKDPATSYRQLFMKMINAMGAASEEDAEKYGNGCVDIASKSLGKDPYWITQMVVVYIALGNDKIRYKKKSETIAYADKAVETAVAAQVHFENDVASVLLAQSLMFRGTVLCLHGSHQNSCMDFGTAFLIYKKQGNTVSAIEACRMAANGAFKSSQPVEGVKILADGARLGKMMSRETVLGSTYPGVLELLIKSNHHSLISMIEIDEIATNLYGNNWVDIVNNWKQPPDQDKIKRQEQEMAAA